MTMKTLHAVWMVAIEIEGVIAPAHAEVWQFVEGDRYGTFVAELPEWAEEDCR